MIEFFELLEYDFFSNALIGILIISIAAAIIGTYIISRRMVSIAGGVTHACFGGLGLGYFLGLNPIIMAMVFAVGSSAGVEWLSARHRVREDSAIAVVWALGMAIGVLFVFMTPGYVPELNAFLFGNILTITTADLCAFAIYTLILILFFSLSYDKIVMCAFDRDFARVTGMPVRFITYTMTVMVAVCIVLTIKLVGIMLLMSMLSLPQMTAEVFFHRFKGMMIASVAVSVACSFVGLMISASIDVPCSAVIVLLMVVAFIIARLLKTAFRTFKK